LLTVITGNVGLALARLPTDDPSRQLLHVAEQAAWRTAGLVRQLLGFAQHVALRLRPVDVNACVTQVVHSLSLDLDPRIRVELHTPPDLWPVHADALQLHQTLMNVCLNARDAMPEGGLLTLETSNYEVDDAHVSRNLDARLGSFVRLRVRDSGSGIPSEVMPFIFDPYFTTKPVGKGSGLGLAVVYGIVKQHRGWVECDSPTGRGATFDVYLPRGPRGEQPS
jgi:two-component system, cell cycle sensor histidine kinase and response regulator CckA